MSEGSNQVEGLESSRRVIVILGMHRSGTSATTGALSALGVHLGDELLDASGENPRGFLEDEPLLRISDEVLVALGLKWYSTRLISPEEWKAPALDRLYIEAAENIERRFGAFNVWGFKNPRTARLLPFWHRVFKKAGLDESYVIALRNPLSVARSLGTRNGFSLSRSYALWMVHQADAVSHTKGFPRICVDYDAMLADPSRELERIAYALDLAPPTTSAVEEFGREWLSVDLRHTQFSADDVGVDPGMAALGHRAYRAMHAWAAAPISETRKSEIDAGKVLAQVANRLREVSPLFTELDDLESRLLAEMERTHHFEEKIGREREEARLRVTQMDSQVADLGRQMDQLGGALGAAKAGLELQEGIRQAAELRGQRLEEQLEQTNAERDEFAHQVQVARDASAGVAADRDRLEVALQEQTRAVEQIQSESDQVVHALRESTNLESCGLREDLERETKSADSLQGLLTQKLEEGNDREVHVAELERELDEVRTLRLAEFERLMSDLNIADQRADALSAQLTKIEGIWDPNRARDDLSPVGWPLFREMLGSDRTPHPAIREGVEEWSLAWIRETVSDLSIEARAADTTRTWRAARRIQRGFDLVKLRRRHDALIEIAEFAESFAREPIDGRVHSDELRAKARRLALMVEEVFAGEIIRGFRSIARRTRVSLRRPVHEGPADRLVAHARALGVFLDLVERYPVLFFSAIDDRRSRVPEST